METAEEPRHDVEGVAIPTAPRYRVDLLLGRGTNIGGTKAVEFCPRRPPRVDAIRPAGRGETVLRLTEHEDVRRSIGDLVKADLLVVDQHSVNIKNAVVPLIRARRRRPTPLYPVIVRPIGIGG